jgi:hypothetical protein
MTDEVVCHWRSVNDPGKSLQSLATSDVIANAPHHARARCQDAGKWLE